MKNIIKILFASTLLVAITAFAAYAAEPEAASKDADLDEGAWTIMATRYPNPYASEDHVDAPSPEILASWWSSLGDDTLTELIERSLKNNRDLAVARSKVTEARATLGVSKSAVLPWLDNVDSWSRAKTPINSPSGTGQTAEVYRLGLDASWEIDIFGGRAQEILASAASLEAQYAALHNTWVTLSSEVALNYLTLRTLQSRLQIAENNLVLQQDTLNLLQSRYDAGLTDALALNQSKYTLEQTRASVPPLKESIEATLNVLSILVGEVPGSLELMLGEPKALPRPDAKYLVGIPADYLRQRPDIRMAERQLIAQIARKKAARAELWPKFTLVGSIGLESASTGSLFSSDSYGFSFGPRISWPIFHAGAIRNNVRIQTARQEQLLAAYEQTVLNAVAEVRNALAANAQEQQRNVSLKNGVDAAQVALDVANDKYIHGLTDFNNVINAQRALLTLAEQYAVSEGQMTSNIVRLYKALGGGWEPILDENMPEEKREQLRIQKAEQQKRSERDKLIEQLKAD